MKRVLFILLALASLLHAGPSSAALACSITTTSISGIYAAAANFDQTGTFSVTCTRDPTVDPRKPVIWMGINQPVTGNTATRDIGGSSLGYTIYHSTYGTGVWTNTGDAAPAQNKDAGVRDTLDFGNKGAATVSKSYTFYFRTPSGQNSAAGVYLATAAVTLKSDSETGATLSSTSTSITISIQHNCRFSTDPLSVSITYTAFGVSSNPNPTSSFALTCTQGTPFTVSLDRTRSIIPVVGLAYTLSLSSFGTTGSASSTGIAGAQTYTVYLAIPAGQAGSCPATASCSGTDVRTVTVSY